jgi:phenylacetate-CoA ligase
LRVLERSQWLSAAELGALQDRKLAGLITFAAKRCPYYRERLAGALGGSFGVELARLPFLTRQDLQERLEELVDEGADRTSLIKAATGGSTGHPVHFYLDRNRAAYDISAKVRARRWWGVEVGAREVILWGSPIELAPKNKWVACKDRALNTTFFSAFRMRPEDMREYHRRLRHIRPEVVFGYASSLQQFARFLEQEGLRADDLGVKVVITTAELLYDFMREDISRVFGCPVANEYGSRDGGYIAHECPSGRMHVTAESMVLECVDETGARCPPGVEGELVLTHLDNFAMPLIRYRIGDRGALSDETCPCGRSLPVLQVMGGRTHDVIRTTDGSPIHPLFLIYVIRPLAGVKQFRIVQKSLSQMDVLLLTDEKFDPANEGYIVQRYQAFMGEGLRVGVKRVAEIPLTASGKHRWIVSEIE